MSDHDAWRLEASRSLSIGRYAVGYDRLTRPDGGTTRRGWLEAPDSVAVVATRGGDVVLIEEYRPRLGETVLSCPVGGREDGESFAAAGVRELREETGFRADDATLAAVTYPVAWLRRRRGIVLAPDCEAGDSDPEDDEFVEVRLVSADRAVETVRSGPGPATDWTLVALSIAREEGLL